jgi:hypothetical protein
MKAPLEFIVNTRFLEQFYKENAVGALRVMACVKNAMTSGPNPADMPQVRWHSVKVVRGQI